MEKVVNSVRQIVQECEELISQGISSEFIDVRGLAETLKTECVSLQTLFDNNPEKEFDILRKKREVEALAIRLEFYLNVRLGLFAQRKTLRAFVATLYQDCREAAFKVISEPSSSNDTVTLWASRMMFANNLLSRSKHIIFECSQDDSNRIKEISTALQEVNK